MNGITFIISKRMLLYCILPFIFIIISVIIMIIATICLVHKELKGVETK